MRNSDKGISGKLESFPVSLDERFESLKKEKKTSRWKETSFSTCCFSWYFLCHSRFSLFIVYLAFYSTDNSLARLLHWPHQLARPEHSERTLNLHETSFSSFEYFTSSLWKFVPVLSFFLFASSRYKFFIFFFLIIRWKKKRQNMEIFVAFKRCKIEKL